MTSYAHHDSLATQHAGLVRACGKSQEARQAVVALTTGAELDGHVPFTSARLHHATGPTQSDVPGISGCVTSKPGFHAARSDGTASAGYAALHASQPKLGLRVMTCTGPHFVRSIWRISCHRIIAADRRVMGAHMMEATVSVD